MSEHSDVRLRKALTQVPAYVPGKPAAPREGVTAYKVSSNENPYSPLPSVLKVVQDAAASMNRYPDMAVTELSQALADTLGVPVEHIATGTGSVGVLGQVIQATCDPGDEVIFAWRSFEAYPIVTALAGATAVKVALDEHCRHRLDAMLEAITDRTRVVLVCTPNNPTGPIVHHDELERFLDAVPSRRPGRHRRGLPRVRPRTRRLLTPWPSTATGPTSWSCAPSPRPTAWPGCAWGMPWRTSRSQPPCARRLCRSA